VFLSLRVSSAHTHRPRLWARSNVFRSSSEASPASSWNSLTAASSTATVFRTSVPISLPLRSFQNGPGVGLQAHAAFSGVSIWVHRAVFVVVVAAAAAASAATTARACVACTARHAEVALARHIGKSMSASRSKLLSQKGQVNPHRTQAMVTPGHDGTCRGSRPGLVRYKEPAPHTGDADAGLRAAMV
jgi:hypothetical protein